MKSGVKPPHSKVAAAGILFAGPSFVTLQGVTTEGKQECPPP